MGYGPLLGGGTTPAPAAATSDFFWGPDGYTDLPTLLADLALVPAAQPRRIILGDNLSIPALEGGYDLDHVQIVANTFPTLFTLTIEDGAYCQVGKAPSQYTGISIVNLSSAPWHDQTGETLCAASFTDTYVDCTSGAHLYRLNSGSGQFILKADGACYFSGGLIFGAVVAGGQVQCTMADSSDVGAGAIEVVADATWLQVNYNQVAGATINLNDQPDIQGNFSVSAPGPTSAQALALSVLTTDVQAALSGAVSPGAGNVFATASEAGGTPDILPRENRTDPPLAANWTTANGLVLEDLAGGGIRFSGAGQGGILWRRAVKSLGVATRVQVDLRMEGALSGTYPSVAYMWRNSVSGKIITMGMTGSGSTGNVSISSAYYTSDTNWSGSPVAGWLPAKDVNRLGISLGVDMNTGGALTAGRIYLWTSSDSITWELFGWIDESTVFGGGNHADQHGFGVNQQEGATWFTLVGVIDNMVVL